MDTHTYTELSRECSLEATYWLCVSPTWRQDRSALRLRAHVSEAARFSGTLVNIGRLQGIRSQKASPFIFTGFYCEPDEFSPHLPCYLFFILAYSLFFYRVKCSIQIFGLNLCTHFSYLLCSLCVPPITSYSIWET